ncbi:hypothetical protein NET02_13115 [Thermomicrobiaceae bacterium CFH 74404]|uniref:Lipoprotein n=2 Tax=Thermomicrobia TaxID=189775 RepID=A0AA41WHA0_9BACT|nr:hypothetical protein [Thermalbibacter longus]MCM8750088.1 hypothetical protein [Thermalbibacter longus]
MRGLWNLSRLVATLLLISAVIAGCSRGGASDNQATETGQSNSTEQAGTPTRVAGPAPDPAKVTINDLQMIEEWQNSQIPAYPESSRVRFEPFPSQVENAGMMVFRTDDSPEQVVAFYRGALRALGWEERRADANTVVAERGEAALTVQVNQQEGGTAIVLLLTDAP